MASEVEDVTHMDYHEPEVAQVMQGDGIDAEQGDDVEAASPLAEQSRRDRKLRESHLNSLLIISDKRKVSEAASIFSDSTRDRKRTREDSQPVDEDEPGTFFYAYRYCFAQAMVRSCSPTRPPTHGRFSDVQEIPDGHHHGSCANFPASQWQYFPQPHQNV